MSMSDSSSSVAAAVAAAATTPTGSSESVLRASAAASAVLSRGGGERRVSSAHRSAVSDAENGSERESGSHRESSGDSSSSTSQSSYQQPQHKKSGEIDHQSRRTSSAAFSGPSPVALRGSGRPSSQQSTTTSAATASARVEEARRPNPRSAPTTTSHSSTSPQQLQQQRPSPLVTFSDRHTDADVARVRAALADAGYPNPSRTDIERVFEQMARNTTAQADAQPDRRGDPANVAVTAGKPQSQQQNSLLHYLDPALRLERYVQLRERELESMCLRPPTTPLRGTPQAVSYRSTDVHQEVEAPTEADPVTAGAAVAPSHAQTRSSRQPAAHASADVMTPQQRRAANIVYDITGDQRFRFFPATRTPQGSGALTVASSSASTRRAAVHGARTHTAAEGEPRRSASAVSAALTPCRNFYYPQRAALGGCASAPGHFPATSSSAGPGASARPTHSIAYLDPRGCTLQHRADPVTRGQQMRVLWERDSFLSQRRRPQQAWRTRQITMAYEQGEARREGGATPASS